MLCIIKMMAEALVDSILQGNPVLSQDYKHVERNFNVEDYARVYGDDVSNEVSRAEKDGYDEAVLVFYCWAFRVVDGTEFNFGMLERLFENLGNMERGGE